MHKKKLPGGRFLRWALPFLMAAMLGACASPNKTPARDEIARAETSVNDAQRINADAAAPLEMKLANDKLQQARNDFGQGNYKQSYWLAQEAMAHAKTAEAQARAAGTEAAAKQLRESIAALRQEAQQRQDSNQGGTQ